MTTDAIRKAVITLAEQYSIKSVVLFGSRASGNNRDDSDIDLIIEFYEPISILKLSSLKNKLQDMLGLDVDIVHGPIRTDDILEIGETVEIYAA
ncbi:MAG: nucleotidyltransferase domain-containing protein [Clostridiales bacterium]|nr:nucleotidyltransferase domain-containing protein [Clostridiales bacterium]